MKIFNTPIYNQFNMFNAKVLLSSDSGMLILKVSFSWGIYGLSNKFKGFVLNSIAFRL